jgi:hypothetical protein
MTTTRPYKSKRDRAWRNLLVAAINEALRRGLLSMAPGGNHWPTTADARGHVFRFQLPDSSPVAVYLSDAGFDEIGIHAAVNPKGDRVRASNGNLGAGDAFALGWLERRTGAYLQRSSHPTFRCRKTLLEPLAALHVTPDGFADRGQFFL